MEAVEPEYLQALRNLATDMIIGDIPTIISYLITTYGKLSESELLTMEQNLTATTYDPRQPVDTVFNAIDNYVELANLQEITIDDRCKRQFASVIFLKSRAFIDSLKKWNERPTHRKTYQLMKDFMREEHAQLDAVGALTVQDSLNHVELLRSLQTHQEDLASRLETQLQSNLMSTLTQLGGQMDQHNAPIIPAVTPQTTAVPAQANAVHQNIQQDALLHALQQLTDQVQALGILQPAPPNNDGIPRTNPRTGQPYKRYCWSHGCCGHWGRHCRNKKEGHRDDATFRNRKGGSNKGCLPAQNNGSD